MFTNMFQMKTVVSFSCCFLALAVFKVSSVKSVFVSRRMFYLQSVFTVSDSSHLKTTGVSFAMLEIKPACSLIADFKSQNEI